MFLNAKLTKSNQINSIVKIMKITCAFIVFMLSANLMAQTNFLKVDDAFKINELSQISEDTYQITWQVEPGYYLYEKRFWLKDKESNKLDFIIRPVGVIKDDQNFGKVTVHYDTAKIQLKLEKQVLINNSSIMLGYQGCADAGLCYPPQKKQLNLNDFKALTNNQANHQIEENSPQLKLTQKQNFEDTNDIQALLNDTKLTWLLIGFFLLGLGLSFTPCVLPMMPILAGIITRQGDSLSAKQGGGLALSYVLGMSFSYSVAGVLVGLFGAELNLQAKLQTPWVLIPMASLFLLLALSMFGAFDLKLPDFISQKLNSKQDKLNDKADRISIPRYLNVGLMGAIAALVVSPCITAPLAGVLLYISSTGDAALGASALFVLSLGMGVPLILLGVGGGKFLPKSGIWMIEVKIFFGLVLTGMAVYLLSRILSESISMLLICILIVFYLIHLLQLILGKQTNLVKNLMLTIIFFVSLYVVSLYVSILAGQNTPVTPLAFLANNDSSQGQTNDNALKPTLFSRYIDVEAMEKEIASNTGTPYMVDLYADWCASCQDLEKDVFHKESIMALEGKVNFYQLDITDNTSAHSAYMASKALFGPPSMMFFDSNSREVARFQGVPSLERVISFLQKAQSH